MALTQEQLLHIAKLARLQVDVGEIDQYEKKINEILAYVEQLQEVDLSAVPEMQGAADLTNVWREDIPESCEARVRQNCFDAFPQTEGGQLKVQAVFDRE